VHLSPTSKQEGHRRSDISDSGISTYGLNSLSRGDERPGYAPLGCGTVLKNASVQKAYWPEVSSCHMMQIYANSYILCKYTLCMLKKHRVDHGDGGGDCNDNNNSNVRQV